MIKEHFDPKIVETGFNLSVRFQAPESKQSMGDSDFIPMPLHAWEHVLSLISAIKIEPIKLDPLIPTPAIARALPQVATMANSEPQAGVPGIRSDVRRAGTMIFLLPPAHTEVTVSVSPSLAAGWEFGTRTFSSNVFKIPKRHATPARDSIQWDVQVSPVGNIGLVGTAKNQQYLFWEAQ